MKKSILVFLLIFVLLLNNDIAFADSTFVVLLPTFPEYNTTDYPYYYIRKWDDGNYTLVILSSTYVNSDGTYLYFSGEYRHCAYEPTKNPDSNEWGTMSNYYNGSSWITQICPTNCDMSNNNIVYSNFDIMYRDTLLRSKLEYNSSGFTEVEDNLTLSGIGGFFSDLFSNMENFFSNLINALGNFFSNLSSNILSIGSNIVNAINNIQDFIIERVQSVLVLLFVPQDNIFEDLLDLVEEKFSILFDVKDIIDNITDESLYAGTPIFQISYKGKNYNIIDFSMFATYRTFIQGITSIIVIINTSLWVLRNGPNLINGNNLDNDYC